MQTQTFVFFGIVGSGKGTQVKLLSDYLGGATYIGTGEIFRTMPEVKAILARGELVPDELTNQLVAQKVAASDPKTHWIFDGYPRTIAQSERFEKLMQKYHKENVKIVYIDLSESEAMKRNLLRGRHDDTEEGLKQRFAEYRDKVIPAMQYFEDKPDYQILKINGDQTIEAVHKEIISKLSI